jgi:hypothetical protein
LVSKDKSGTSYDFIMREIQFSGAEIKVSRIVADKMKERTPFLRAAYEASRCLRHSALQVPW